jgi:hypothetical protein
MGWWRHTSRLLVSPLNFSRRIRSIAAGAFFSVARDTYDELGDLMHAMAGITSQLLEIEAEPPPERGDTMGRLNYVVAALARYRQGVSQLHQMVDGAFDRMLDT